MELSPYLIFDGRCHEAMTAYGEILGGSIAFSMPRDDSPGRLQHCRLEAKGQVLHGMDGAEGDAEHGPAPMLLLGCDSPEDAERIFGALTAEGDVTMPIGPTPFAKAFGMGVDAYGIRWTITG